MYFVIVPPLVERDLDIPIPFAFKQVDLILIDHHRVVKYYKLCALQQYRIEFGSKIEHFGRDIVFTELLISEEVTSSSSNRYLPWGSLASMSPHLMTTVNGALMKNGLMHSRGNPTIFALRRNE